MIRIFGQLLLLLGISSSLKYVERRSVVGSSGDHFSCFYTIQYSSKGKVTTKKSSVICDPDLDGGNAVEVLDLPGVGPTSIKLSIKKGKETIKNASAYSSSSSSSLVRPMNCSCKADFPHELVEMMKPGEMLATGRGHGGGGGKGGVGFLLAPLLLVLLLPTFITSLQALLAGRSLNVDTLREELTHRLADRLNSGEFELADVDRLLDQPETQRTFFLSLILNQIRTQIQTQIQALISSLTGGLLGRRLEVSALKARLEERGGTSFSSSVFSQLQSQLVAAIQTAIQNFLAGLGIGRSLSPLQDRQLLLQTALQNCITQIQAAIQNFLAAFGLGRTGLSSSIFSSLQAQILAAIQTAITNFLNSLGLGLPAGRGLDMEAADRQLFGNLLGALTAETQTTTTTPPPDTGDIQEMITMMEQIMAEMTGTNGGMEEMIQSAMEQMMTEMTGMSGGLEEMMAMMEQLEQMNDEEIMQQVMEMMEANGGELNLPGGGEVMAMFVSELEKPASCHCLPSQVEHGLLAG